MRGLFTGRGVPSLRWAATILIAFVLLVVGIDATFRYGHDGPVSNPTDFRAFYCGGLALREGENPYRFGTMRTCNDTVLATNGLRADDRHVLPAPLPPYALAVFAVLSNLPFRLATEVWLSLNILAVVTIILMISNMNATRPVIVALAFVLSLGFASVVVAQLVPIALCGLTYCAWAIRRTDFRGAAIGAFIGALEPHLAAPVWLALAMCVPRARAPLCVAGAVVLALSSFHFALDVEYARSILPAHARSELFDSSAQYSLSTLLVSLGAPLRAAMLAGSLSYIFMCAVGIALGALLRRRFDDNAFVVLTPLATVLIGGPFLHDHQLAAALPLAFLLASHSRMKRGSRAIAFVAICALAIPWESIAELPILADRPSAHPVSAVQPKLALPRADDSLEISYTAFIDAFANRLDRRDLREQILWKVPSWAALLLILGVAVRLSRGGVNVPPSLAES